jgi:uncharacterized protein (TIGR00106 family)
MIVADFAMVPMGSGTSAAKYIRSVYEVLREVGVKFVPGPMSTSVETKSFEELFDIIEKANRRLADMGVKRIITSVNIDYRLDKEITIESKLGATRLCPDRFDPETTYGFEISRLQSGHIMKCFDSKIYSSSEK